MRMYAFADVNLYVRTGPFLIKKVVKVALKLAGQTVLFSKGKMCLKRSL